MELFFKILAVILGGVAAYFLWQGSPDNGFVAAVLGAVAFFLSVRFQVKGRLKEREAARAEEERRISEEEEFEQEEFEEDQPDFEVPQINEMPAGQQFDKQRRTTNDEQKI